MRLFYRTVATFPERKRKPRQCPEKLRTIGKYTSCFFLFFYVCICSSMCKHTHILNLLFSCTQPSFCCLGRAFCFGLVNKHCHAYTVNPAANTPKNPPLLRGNTPDVYAPCLSLPALVQAFDKTHLFSCGLCT